MRWIDKIEYMDFDVENKFYVKKLFLCVVQLLEFARDDLRSDEMIFVSGECLVACRITLRSAMNE